MERTKISGPHTEVELKLEFDPSARDSMAQAPLFSAEDTRTDHLDFTYFG